MVRGAIFKIGVILVAAFALLGGLAAAQNLDTYDDKLIAQFNSADSPDSIPVGTKITSANWQQYRKFLTVSVQAFMSGNYFWKMGSGPDNYIEIGPTITTVLPTKYKTDTEKYTGEAQVVKLPSGAYEIKNYGAGIPFPRPSDRNS